MLKYKDKKIRESMFYAMLSHRQSHSKKLDVTDYVFITIHIV